MTVSSWTEFGIFLCNVVEGLALAVILLVFGALILRERGEHDDH